MPWFMLVKSYQHWAHFRGYPPRTEEALRQMTKKLGVDRRSVGEWITTGVIATHLGLCSETVRRWITRNWLPAKRFGTSRAHQHYVSRASLRRLSRERPELFAGRSLSDLIMLLDSERAAQQVVDGNHRRQWQQCPVVCVETGKRFPTIAAAARHAYVTPEVMRRAVRTGGRANGRHWRLA
jgi:IS30 family transposase